MERERRREELIGLPTPSSSVRQRDDGETFLSLPFPLILSPRRRRRREEEEWDFVMSSSDPFSLSPPPLPSPLR